MIASDSAPAPPRPGPHQPTPQLRARRLGIDTYRQPVVYMRADCHVCRAEGFEAQSQVEVRAGLRSIVATLQPVHGELLARDEAGLSEAAMRSLGVEPGTPLSFRHARSLKSFRYLRAKIYGRRLSDAELHAIVRDIAAGRYSDLHLAAFVVACANDGLDLDETIALTRAMIDAGSRLQWARSPVVDKHCVGGLPGNRTTPIVVAIAAACGAVIPKTSSRAITSPAGTADTMETLAPVDLDLAAMRRVVEREGGCIVWGGAVQLSPADDVLIRVERPLDLDSEAQLVASVLSKKVAAGSQYVLIDLPVGATAKVRSAQAAERLIGMLEAVGTALELEVRCIVTDGAQPVGRGIGPALEAHDVLAVLQRTPDAPLDLRERSLALAGALLEVARVSAPGEGVEQARAALDDGRAWRKFVAICEAQGGLREPGRAAHTAEIPATRAGRIIAIDNRRLARVAKLAGAPRARSAGVFVYKRLGDSVQQGEPLFSVHAEAPGELAYALEYVAAEAPPFQIEPQA